jgi:hypothetical protein
MNGVNKGLTEPMQIQDFFQLYPYTWRQTEPRGKEEKNILLVLVSITPSKEKTIRESRGEPII